MPSARELRAGLVFVEMGIDRAFLQAELDKAKAQVAKTAADMNKAGAAGGGFGAGAGGPPAGKWMQMVARGAGVAYGLETLAGTVSGFIALLKGDWEGAIKGIRQVPVLGAVAVDVADAVDALFLGTKAYVAGLKKAAQEFQDYTTGVSGLGELGLKFQRRAWMIGQGPGAEAAEKIHEEAMTAIHEAMEIARKKGIDTETHPGFKKTLRDIVNWENKATAEAARAPDIKKYQDALARAEDDWAKLNLSEEEYIARQIEMLGLPAEQEYRLIDLLLENKETAEKQKEAAEGAKKAAEEASRMRQEVLDDARRHDEERVRTLEEITRSVETPEEEFMRRKGELDKALEEGLPQDIYERAIRKALEQAAAALPDLVGSTYRAKGTFWGMESAMGMGGAGGTEVLLRKTADSSEKTARLLQRLADEGIPLVWN